MQTLFAQTLHRLTARALIISLCGTAVSLPAQAAMLDSAQVIAHEQAAGDSTAHRQLLAQLDRSEVASRLAAAGVDPERARARVAALSDHEAAQLAQDIEHAPAGGIIDTLVFLFLVLLATDILGLTKVFPFTRPVR